MIPSIATTTPAPCVAIDEWWLTQESLLATTFLRLGLVILSESFQHLFMLSLFYFPVLRSQTNANCTLATSLMMWHRPSRCPLIEWASRTLTSLYSAWCFGMFCYPLSLLPNTTHTNTYIHIHIRNPRYMPGRRRASAVLCWSEWTGFLTGWRAETGTDRIRGE